MGKPTGFLEYKRETARVLPPKVRIANFNEFRTPLSKEKQKTQGARYSTRYSAPFPPLPF